jgi:hypothetical protein
VLRKAFGFKMRAVNWELVIRYLLREPFVIYTQYRYGSEIKDEKTGVTSAGKRKRRNNNSIGGKITWKAVMA